MKKLFMILALIGIFAMGTATITPHRTEKQEIKTSVTSSEDVYVADVTLINADQPIAEFIKADAELQPELNYCRKAQILHNDYISRRSHEPRISGSKNLTTNLYFLKMKQPVLLS